MNTTAQKNKVCLDDLVKVALNELGDFKFADFKVVESKVAAAIDRRIEQGLTKGSNDGGPSSN